MTFYPVYLTQLDRKPVILLGGNDEAERKTCELLAFGARVHVISKKITAAMEHWWHEGQIQWTPRTYRYGDLKDAGFVVAAEYSMETAKTASNEANERNLLINVMDNIPLSNSAFGSVVRQGKLTLSLSTSGLAPALAVRLKERLQHEIDAAYGEFLVLADTLRPVIMSSGLDADERKAKWYEWVDSEVIPLLRNGQRRTALEITACIWGSDLVEKAIPESVVDSA